MTTDLRHDDSTPPRSPTPEPPWAESDFRDPEVVRHALVDVWHWLAEATRTATRIDAVTKGLGPHMAALARDRDHDVAEIAKISRTVQAIGRTVEQLGASVETLAKTMRFTVDEDRAATQAALLKLRDGLKATQKVINASPAMGNVAEITGIHHLPTMLDAELQRREGAAALAVLKKNRERAWDIAKLILAGIVGILVTMLARKLGLK